MVSHIHERTHGRMKAFTHPTTKPSILALPIRHAWYFSCMTLSVQMLQSPYRQTGSGRIERGHARRQSWGEETKRGGWRRKRRRKRLLFT